ncbi:MAG: DUF433 domain-containing protein [Anaerolineales bacterium]|nr:DUF433 domain-containing protein [Anaerolineales bacterium]
MSRYPLSLPQQLKQKAEDLARRQGVSLNQFILWAVAEKVGALGEGLADPNYPGIGYRRGPTGQPIPVLQGYGLRVQTLVVGHHDWGMNPQQLAEAYGVSEAQVKEALAFYQAHRTEIEAAIQADSQLESARG